MSANVLKYWIFKLRLFVDFRLYSRPLASQLASPGITTKADDADAERHRLGHRGANPEAPT
jgi:hypothetical protein